MSPILYGSRHMSAGQSAFADLLRSPMRRILPAQV